MPPPQKEERPVMARAHPADAIPGGPYHEPRARYALARFGDGTWRLVTILSWRRDRSGRWVCSLQWNALNDTWTEQYIYDPGALRPADDG